MKIQVCGWYSVSCLDSFWEPLDVELSQYYCCGIYLIRTIGADPSSGFALRVYSRTSDRQPLRYHRKRRIKFTLYTWCDKRVSSRFSGNIFPTTEIIFTKIVHAGQNCRRFENRKITIFTVIPNGSLKCIVLRSWWLVAMMVRTGFHSR